MLGAASALKITYELSYCFDCKIRDRNSVMSSRQAQTSVSIKRMPAKILMGSYGTISDLKSDGKGGGVGEMDRNSLSSRLFLFREVK